MLMTQSDESPSANSGQERKYCNVLDCNQHHSDYRDYRPSPRVKKSIFILCERIRGPRPVTMRGQVAPYSDIFQWTQVRGETCAGSDTVTPEHNYHPELGGCPQTFDGFQFSLTAGATLRQPLTVKLFTATL